MKNVTVTPEKYLFNQTRGSAGTAGMLHPCLKKKKDEEKKRKKKRGGKNKKKMRRGLGGGGRESKKEKRQRHSRLLEFPIVWGYREPQNGIKLTKGILCRGQKKPLLLQ